MRVAFDSKRYYHNHTGLGNYSHTLVDGLQSLDPGFDALLLDAPTLERTFCLGRKARAEGALLYHGLSNELPFDIRRIGLPSVVTIHDVCWRTFPGMYHYVDRCLYDWKYGWAARNANHVLAISESTKHDVIQYFDVPEQRITTIYQPVADLYYSPISRMEAQKRIRDAGIEVPGQFMLYVGSVNARKNMLGVVRAMAQMPASCRIPLVAVGGGRRYKDKVCSEIGRLGLTGMVQWISIADNAVLQALYTLAHLFVYPSFYEGFGLPVVEAALSGCPVVTSNVSSLPEAGGPCTLQANPSSIDDIQANMEKGICDTELRNSMIDGARRYAQETFSPQRLLGQVLDLYASLV